MTTRTRRIKDKLKWRKYYPVFGNWSCENCENEWFSAWTYISIEKFEHEAKSDDLEPSDHVNQRCKQCDSRQTKIIQYKPLKRKGPGINKKAHEYGLCAKCKTGAICGQRSIDELHSQQGPNDESPDQKPTERKPLADKPQN